MTTLDQPIEGFADITVNQGGKPITLHSYKYPAKTPEPKAINLLFHGYSEYLGCALRPYATYLAEKGICSIGIDQRGFGLSQGVRGYFESFDCIVADTKKFLDLAKERDPQLKDKPLFLTGLSMGGASCLHFSLKQPDLPKAMIMFSPAVSLVTKEVKRSTLLSKLPSLPQSLKRLGSSDFPHNILSDNQDLVNLLLNDPIVYKGKFPLGSIQEFMHSGKYLIKNADKIRTPFILFQGDADRIVDPKSVKEVYEKAVGVKNKKLIMVPNGDHLILVDPTKMEDMQKQIGEWISQFI